VVGGGGGFASPQTTAGHAGDRGWVFPVDKPLAPEDGDNQALAVNTTDNSVEYQAAFAMVVVDDGSDAMNVNEAQAYASCESCRTVAVAYQIVIVVDTDDTDDNVAVPQNLAGALNYDCVNCVTYALAQQLFVTVDKPLTDAQKLQLAELWLEMQAYAAVIEYTKPPPDQVAAQLDRYDARALDILDVEAPAPTTAVTQPQAAPTPTGSQPPPTAANVAVAPPSGEPTASTAPTESTTAPTTSDTSTSTDPTGDNVSVASTADSSASTDPTAPSNPTADPTPTDISTTDPTPSAGTTDGSATDGSTSGSSTSDGAASP
jgi:putative peptide zinc metalloprotease protein